MIFLRFRTGVNPVTERLQKRGEGVLMNSTVRVRTASGSPLIIMLACLELHSWSWRGFSLSVSVEISSRYGSWQTLCFLLACRGLFVDYCFKDRSGFFWRRTTCQNRFTQLFCPRWRSKASHFLDSFEVSGCYLWHDLWQLWGRPKLYYHFPLDKSARRSHVRSYTRDRVSCQRKLSGSLNWGS